MKMQKAGAAADEEDESRCSSQEAAAKREGAPKEYRGADTYRP
jgi:hypothetical protein